MARPMRSKVRAFGRFSSREIVDCERSSRSDGDKSSAILNIGSLRRELASFPSSYPAANSSTQILWMQQVLKSGKGLRPTMSQRHFVISNQCAIFRTHIQLLDRSSEP